MRLEDFVCWDFGDHGFTALAFPTNDVQTGIKTQVFIASILGQDFKPHGAYHMFAFCTVATFLRELEKLNLIEEVYPWLRAFVKKAFLQNYRNEILNNTPSIIKEINDTCPLHGSDYPSTIKN
jgi:hypothetical protein